MSAQDWAGIYFNNIIYCGYIFLAGLRWYIDTKLEPVKIKLNQ
jgi:hypothetical protein